MEDLRVKNISTNLQACDLQNTFISFLDSDDFLHPMAFQNFMKTYKQTKSDIIRGSEIFINRYGEPINKYQTKAPKFSTMTICDFLAQTKMKYFVFNATNCLVKAEIFKQVRYPEGIINEDMSFGFDLLLHSHRISFCNFITYYHRIRSGSISHPSTFLNQHSALLLEKTFIFQINYLLSLLQQNRQAPYAPLIQNTLKVAATSLIINILYKDPQSKKRLKPFLIHTGIKAKLCYLFPKSYRFLRKIKYRLYHKVKC